MCSSVACRMWFPLLGPLSWTTPLRLWTLRSLGSSIDEAHIYNSMDRKKGMSTDHRLLRRHTVVWNLPHVHKIGPTFRWGHLKAKSISRNPFFKIFLPSEMFVLALLTELLVLVYFRVLRVPLFFKCKCICVLSSIAQDVTESTLVANTWQYENGSIFVLDALSFTKFKTPVY